MSPLKHLGNFCVALACCALLQTGCGPNKGMSKGEEGNIPKDAPTKMVQMTAPIPSNVKSKMQNPQNPTGFSSGNPVPPKK